MDRKNILLWVFLIATVAGGVSLCTLSTISRLDVEFVQNQTELNKTGYVLDIKFIGGGIKNDPAEQTIVRFGDGDVVVLRYWEMRIPTKQNITLHYHNNGYERYFLDDFTVLREMVGEK